MGQRRFRLAWAIAGAPGYLSLGVLACSPADGRVAEPSEPSAVAGSARVLVRSILSDAALNTLPHTGAMTFEQVVQRAAQNSNFVSAPRVVVTNGSKAELQLPEDASLRASWNLTRYAVAAEPMGPATSTLRISLELAFASGWTAATTLVVEPEQLVFAELNNGLALVTQAVPIAPRELPGSN